MSTKPCSCGGHHHAGANYYVSVADGPRRVGLLLGPFDNHPDALAKVEIGRQLAEKADPRAVFYAFGTVAMESTYTKPGVLNDLLLQEQS